MRDPTTPRMTLTLPRSPLSRRLLRALAAFALAAMLAFAAVAATLWFWFLPHIADYRADLAALMSRALGQRVTLEAVSADWRSWRPEVRMDGVRIHDREGRAALYLPRLEGSFAWRSLLLLEPRFSRIQLRGLTLAVRRLHDGRFLVGGLPVDPAAPDSGFANWALRQGEIRVADAALTWIDEPLGAPPLTLSAVELSLTNTLRRHVLTLHATPPADLARPVDATLEFRGRADDPSTWDGTLNARFVGLALDGLDPWAATAYWPRTGRASAKLTVSFADGALTQARAAIDARKLVLQLGDALPPLALEKLRGGMSWRREGGQRVALERLHIERAGEKPGAPFDLAYGWSGELRRVEAKDVDLARMHRYLPYFPLPPEARNRFDALRPAGWVDAIDLTWRGAGEQLELVSVRADARALTLAAMGATPGFAGLSVRIEGDQHSGTFSLNGKAAMLDLPGVFREPRVPLDRLAAEGGWKRIASGTLFRLKSFDFANADLAGKLGGGYEYRRGQVGVASLEGHLDRADGTRVYRYLPLKVGDHTVSWVQRGVLAGGSRDVRFVLKGDLARFPFQNGGGEFVVDAAIENGVLDYARGWPRIEGVAARLLFERGLMRVETKQARIYNVALYPVTATIPDLMHHDEHLLVQGRALGPAADFVRFANFSPVGARLRGVTHGMAANGNLNLALKIDVPLRRSDDTAVGGALQFLGGTLHPAGLPPLDNARGVLTFTGDTLAGAGLGAQLLGGPVRVATRTSGGKVLIEAHGRATASGLAAWLRHDLGQHLSGQADWRGVLTLARGADTLAIQSGLQGLVSSLPAPLAKSANAPLALTFFMRSGDGGAEHELRLGAILGAKWRSAAGGEFERGELRFGAPATLPAEPGFSVAGRTGSFDLSGWLGLAPGGEAGGAGLAAVDLDFDAFEFMGRRFANVHVAGRTRAGVLRLALASPALDGALTWRAAGQGPARLAVKFRRLAIPGVGGGGGPAAGGVAMKAGDFPALDLEADEFSLDGRTLGRLEAQAHGAPEGLEIDRLVIEHADSRFDMSGRWRDGGRGETRARVALDIRDAGKFLARFGLPDTVARGKAEFKGELNWEGSPADFALDQLAGSLAFKSTKGQFLKVEPGAGRLLGILSLQALPRRLLFDFRDLFSGGYAYDEISATMRIARGVVYSDDFRMSGPAARVEMSGTAALDRETVQLRVKVSPKLSESVAIAGALLGGPLAGVGALAAQKLLRDPFEAAASREFLVSGSWQEPAVEKLAKAPAAKSQPE